MRELPFFILLAVPLSLGGCASTPPAGFCARVSDFAPRQEFRRPPLRNKSLRRITASHSKALHHVAASRPLNDSPEPRFTSAEWWLRENAKLAKATTICRGCLAPTANASLANPTSLSSKSDLYAIPTGSINRFEGSIAVETQSPP